MKAFLGNWGLSSTFLTTHLKLIVLVFALAAADPRRLLARCISSSEEEKAELVY